jgi:hypothetical protein
MSTIPTVWHEVPLDRIDLGGVTDTGTLHPSRQQQHDFGSFHSTSLSGTAAAAGRKTGHLHAAFAHIPTKASVIVTLQTHRVCCMGESDAPVVGRLQICTALCVSSWTRVCSLVLAEILGCGGAHPITVVLLNPLSIC